MPRYFFHSEDHVVIRDFEGQELADENEARIESVHRFTRIIADRPMDIWSDKRFRMTVADKGGRILFSLEMHTEKAAGVVPWSRPSQPTSGAPQIANLAPGGFLAPAD